MLHPPDAFAASSTHWTVYAHRRKISMKKYIKERKVSTKPFPPTWPKIWATASLKRSLRSTTSDIYTPGVASPVWTTSRDSLYETKKAIWKAGQCPGL
jgi:malic enzyme